MSDPATREQQARRLLSSTSAEDQVARFITEWVGVDKVVETGINFQYQSNHYETDHPKNTEHSLHSGFKAPT